MVVQAVLPSGPTLIGTFTYLYSLFHSNSFFRHVKSHQRIMESNQRRDRGKGSEQANMHSTHNHGTIIPDHEGLIGDPSRRGDWNFRERKRKETAVKVVESIALAVEKDKLHDSSDKPFACTVEQCTRRFKKKNHLDAHMVVHDADKNSRSDHHSTASEGGSSHKRKKKTAAFECDACNKKFSRNCELTRHKLNHSTEWPFVCTIQNCGRKFKRRDIFRNHEKTHRKSNTVAHAQPGKVTTKQIAVTLKSKAIKKSINRLRTAKSKRLHANSQPAASSESAATWDQPGLVSLSLVPVVAATATLPGQQVITSDAWSRQTTTDLAGSTWIPLTEAAAWQTVSSVDISWTAEADKRPETETAAPTVLEQLGLRPTNVVVANNVQTARWTESTDVSVIPTEGLALDTFAFLSQ